MSVYAIPQTRKPPKLGKRQVQLIANGDLRITANQKCWPEQAKMEESLRVALADSGFETVRAFRTRNPKNTDLFSRKRKACRSLPASIPMRR